jgi:bifunctional UDP-N-acetylglucosamine pyrophosphorylase/glucosamine-1-phosphate N-acetyltransferase
MANAGIYLLTEDIFDVIARTPKSVRGEYEITDSLQLFLDRGDPIYYQKLTDWVDLSYPWDMLKVNDQMLNCMKTEINGTVEDYVVIKGNVSVGRGSVIKSGSYLVGPIAIGENCNIGPNCYIRSYTTVGDHCHVGAACEVKHSIIMKNSNLPHLNYVGDTIIGENCNLGAGTKIANLRHDHHNVKAGGIDTQHRKFGAIIGSHVQTGINSSINVGAMIGNNTFIYPGATVNGVIPPNSTIQENMCSQIAAARITEDVHHQERLMQFVK